MLAMLQDLVQHKWSANAGLLRAIGQHPRASQDEELRKLLHHILIANRYWLSLCVGAAFSVEEESVIPQSLDALAARYRETCVKESEWIAQIQEADLARAVESSYMPGQRFSIGQAMMQVCMHSLGHRAQCATTLRNLGGTPPAMDFIIWLKERSVPEWDWIVQPFQ